MKVSWLTHLAVNVALDQQGGNICKRYLRQGELDTPPKNLQTITNSGKTGKHPLAPRKDTEMLIGLVLRRSLSIRPLTLRISQPDTMGRTRKSKSAARMTLKRPNGNTLISVGHKHDAQSPSKPCTEQCSQGGSHKEQNTFIQYHEETKLAPSLEHHLGNKERNTL